MAAPADKFFLHVTPVEKSLSIERVSFSPAVLDQLPVLVGDRSGQCHVEITRRYFRNHPLFVSKRPTRCLLDIRFPVDRWES